MLLLIITYLIYAAVAYFIIKTAVKIGVKEALKELHLVEKDAVRTIDLTDNIDTPNKDKDDDTYKYSC